MNAPKITHSNGVTSFVGREAVNYVACITVANALSLYARTGMKVNRAYTPTAMLKFVENTTGRKFKRGKYAEASSFLKEFATAQRVTLGMDAPG